MKTRIITAFIGFLIAVAAITLGGYWYDAILVLLALKGWHELCRMLEKQAILMPKIGGGIFIFISLGALSLEYYSLALVMILFSIFFMWMRFTFSPHTIKLGDMAFSCFGLMYACIGFGALLLIRKDAFLQGLHLPFVSDYTGMIVLWLLLFTTWASDTFAYFTGVAFGKHKIVPHISPNKTAEGYMGGFIGCIITGLVFAFIVGIPYSMGACVGVLSGILAPLGDLFESKLKRSCDVKDSGTLLPGHGGVLDRFDSLFFTAPALLLYCMLMG